MKNSAKIFSRLSSKRLKNKALVKINNSTLLELVINRTKLLKNVDEIIVATSKKEEDNKIVKLAKKNGVKFFCGDINNLIKRSINCCNKFKIDAFLRICGDRPLFDLDLKSINYEVETVEKYTEVAEKGGYEHFMLKEIFEQPKALQDSLTELLVDSPLERLGLNWKIGSISIVACGTSYHAGLVGKYVIEQLTAIPVSVGYSSEFRYAAPVQGVGGLLSSRPLVVLISIGALTIFIGGIISTSTHFKKLTNF